MALLNYKINDPIQVIFQAGGAASGIVVTMNVYDEAGVFDVGKSGAMVEIGTTGRYQKSFTPAANGEWSVQIADANGSKAVASYSVGTYNLQSIGATGASTAAMVDAVDGKIDTLASDLATMDAKIDIIDTKLANIQAPPMIG